MPRPDAVARALGQRETDERIGAELDPGQPVDRLRAPRCGLLGSEPMADARAEKLRDPPKLRLGPRVARLEILLPRLRASQ